MMVRVFANGPGDLGSVPDGVIPKTQKMLMHPCLTLCIIRYVSRVKWGNPGKGVATSPIPWCSSYRKGSLRVTLDYGCQLYLLYTHTWTRKLTQTHKHTEYTLVKKKKKRKNTEYKKKKKSSLVKKKKKRKNTEYTLVKKKKKRKNTEYTLVKRKRREKIQNILS